MAQALGITADAYLVLEMIAEKLNQRQPCGVDKDVGAPEGLISLLIIYFVISNTFSHARAIVTSGFFQRFQAIIKRYDVGETFNAYFEFGLPVLDQLSRFGVDMGHDHWIRVKAVEGMFTPATLWADLVAALGLASQRMVSRRGVEGNSTMQVSHWNKPTGGQCVTCVFYPAPTLLLRSSWYTMVACSNCCNSNFIIMKLQHPPPPHVCLPIN